MCFIADIPNIIGVVIFLRVIIISSTSLSSSYSLSSSPFSSSFYSLPFLCLWEHNKNDLHHNFKDNNNFFILMQIDVSRKLELRL